MFNSLTKNINIVDYSISKQAVNSYLAGLISSIITLPFWTLRLRVSQISYNKSESYGKGIKLVFILLKESFSSLESFKSLYKGIIPTLILSIYPAIQMTIYQQIKNKTKEESFRKYISTFAGALSQFITSFIVFPLNFIKSKQQQLSKVSNEYLNSNLYENKFNEKKYISIRTAVKSIWNDYGITGFYRGCTPLLIKNIIKGGVFFYFYENTNHYLKK